MTDEEMKTPQYGHYQVEIPSQSPVPPQKKKPKKNSFGKKLGTTIVLGIVFGLVAGTVFLSVNVVYHKTEKKETATKVETTQTIPDTSISVEDVVAESGTVAGVAEAAMPSVVAITSVSIQEIPSFFGYSYRAYPSTGSGSGIIVGENDEELLIATNNHVVEGADTLSVCFIGNDVMDAEEETMNLVTGGDLNIENAVSANVKGTDPDNDLAVVAVKKSDIPSETMSQIKIAQLGNSDSLVMGEQVVAIGNALGYGQSVTSGYISALERTVVLDNGGAAEMLQTDAAINPGNSGGALLNMKGELVGINSAKYADNAVEGIGYAIPISKAQPILEELMNRKTRTEKVKGTRAAYLGVTPTDLSVEAMQMYNMPAGAFIIETAAGEAADQAGIQIGDIIVKLDGQKVSGRRDLMEKLQYYEAGEEVEIVIARASRSEYMEQTLNVILGSREAAE